MTELKALGLVNMQEADLVCSDGITRSGFVITLKEEFDWFLSEEFRTLREGFEPEATEEKIPLEESENTDDDSYNININISPDSNGNGKSNNNDKINMAISGGKFLPPPIILQKILQLPINATTVTTSQTAKTIMSAM
jgi:hypothetical protein